MSVTRFKACIFTMMSCFWLGIAFAQDATVQTLKTESSREIVKDAKGTLHGRWQRGGLYNLNVNQASLNNWSAGGDKFSLSIASALNTYAFYKHGKHVWDNTLNLAYGVTNTTTLGTRKSDDRIDLLSKYGYAIGKRWYLTALFNFRSQFSKGFDYSTSPMKTLTSDFLSPAYVLVSPGFSYKANNDFSFFISPATARWIIVNNAYLSSIGAFGVDPGKHVKFQFGAFSTIGYMKKINANAAYTGRLDLFSNYLLQPQNIALYLTNTLAVKVTKLLSMSLSVNAIYDDHIKTLKSDGTIAGPKIQLQELFGMGLAYKF